MIPLAVGCRAERPVKVEIFTPTQDEFFRHREIHHHQ